MIYRYGRVPTDGERVAAQVAGFSVAAVEAGMRNVVGRIRAKFPGVRIIGATLTSALGSSNANHGFLEEDAKRKALNEFIRTGGPARRNSSPRARSAGRATNSTRTGQAIWRWGWRSMRTCSGGCRSRRCSKPGKETSLQAFAPVKPPQTAGRIDA